MLIAYSTCKSCNYNFNPSTEKLCLYCRKKMPKFDVKSSQLFTKGYMPLTFYGKIRKMFRELYPEPNINITYSVGSRGRSANIELMSGHFLSDQFFSRVEMCDGRVTWLHNSNDRVEIKVRQK